MLVSVPVIVLQWVRLPLATIPCQNALSGMANLLWIQFPANVPGRAADDLPPIQEIKIDFLAPGLGVTHAWLVWSFGERTVICWFTMSLCIYVCVYLCVCMCIYTYNVIFKTLVRLLLSHMWIPRFDSKLLANADPRRWHYQLNYLLALGTSLGHWMLLGSEATDGSVHSL